MENEKLKKLLEQKAVLEARIRQEQNRENQKKKKADTRRKILAGAAVLDEAEKHHAYKVGLMRLLDSFLSRPDDRKLFGLEPLSESTGGKKTAHRNGLVSMEEGKKSPKDGEGLGQG